jgi:hypothetical protein
MSDHFATRNSLTHHNFLIYPLNGFAVEGRL